MKTLKILLSLVLTFNIAACNAFGTKESNNASSPVTRVFVTPSCPKGTQAESLGAVLGGLFIEPLVTAGIKGLGSALQKAGEDEVTTVTGQKTTHFYSVELGKEAQEDTGLKLEMKCITIVHGPLNKANSVQKDQVSAFLTRYPEVHKADVYIYLSPLDISGDTQLFTDDISFFAQYEVDLSDDYTAMRLNPKRALSGSRIGNKKNSTRDLVVITSIAKPAKDGSDGVFSIATSNFPKLSENKFFSNEDLLAMSSGWMPLPGIPDVVSSRIKANTKRRLDLQGFEDSVESLINQIANENDIGKKMPLIAKKSSADKSIKRLEKSIKLDQEILKSTSPVTINVTLIETQKGNQFLTKLGSYLSENSATIAKPVAAAIDPAQRGAAKAAEGDAEDSQRIAAIEAVATYEEENAKKGADRSDSKIRVAKIKASQACRKLRAAEYDDVACIGY